MQFAAAGAAGATTGMQVAHMAPAYITYPNWDWAENHAST
jgi:hypothetical protein